jgi:hypothetical protein
MKNAGQLTFTTAPENSVGWDNSVMVYGSEDYAILHSIYSFQATEGATYDFFSWSYFDPFLLRIYDQNGNTIEVNDEIDDMSAPINGVVYESDIIFEWVAPYTGTYYVDANWWQGDYYTFYNLSVYEDVDTISTSVPVVVDPVEEIDDRSDIDHIFNWGELVYSDLLPEHQASIEDYHGYYARIYSNGDAVGEKDGNIYYYDGGSNGIGEVLLVGTVSDLLSQSTIPS